MALLNIMDRELFTLKKAFYDFYFIIESPNIINMYLILDYNTYNLSYYNIFLDMHHIYSC